MSDHIVTVDHIPGMTPDQEAARRAQINTMTRDEFQAFAGQLAEDGGREVRLTRDSDGLTVSATPRPKSDRELVREAIAVIREALDLLEEVANPNG